MRRRNLKTQQSPAILDLSLRKSRAGKSRDYRNILVFEKLRFQNVFLPRWGPVHTNPFSNQNVAVLLRFQKRFASTLTVFISFSPVHTATAYPFWKRFYPLSSPPFWILTVEWSGARSCLFWWRHRFQKASFSNRSTLAPFSVIVFGVVVWTIAISGAKQLRFRLKTDLCGRGLKHKTGVFVTDQCGR